MLITTLLLIYAAFVSGAGFAIGVMWAVSVIDKRNKAKWEKRM